MPLNTVVPAGQDSASASPPERRGFGRRALRLFDDTEFVWVMGLALLLVFLTRHAGVAGLPPHWTQYLVLGSLFPAGLLLLSLAKPFQDVSAVPSRVGRAALALCFPAITFTFFTQNHSREIVDLAEIQSVLTLLALWVQKRQDGGKADWAKLRRDVPANLPKIIFLLFTTILVWDVAAKMGWWYKLPLDAFQSRTQEALMALILGWVTWGLYWPQRLNLDRRRAALAAVDVLALAVFAACSLRTDHLFNSDAYHHWSVWVGPAELVRQGGWLLWDVPSQYGFLSILTLAALPAHSVWQSLYLGIAAAQIVAAVVVYALFRMRGGGVGRALFALSIAWVAVFLMPGMAPGLFGSIVYPGSSPYRFVWCYALLGLLAWECRAGKGVTDRRTFFIGSLLWLVGVFWSAESAIYCTLTWLPACGILLWRRRQDVRYVLSRLAMPLAALGAALALLRAYYGVRLGHGPDWSSFYEYGVSFKDGFSAYPLEPAGPVWVLVLSLCALSAAAVFLLRREGACHRAAALVTGAWGASWATSSYFLSRSHPNNVDNLIPFCCVALAVTLLAYGDQGCTEVTLLKAAFAPVLAAILYMTVGNVPLMRLYPATVARGYDRTLVDKLPVADASLSRLLSQARVRPDDPIVDLDLNHMPAWTYSDGRATRLVSTPRAWLPIMPYSLMQPITVRRQGQYMARFAAQTRLSGWYIEPKTNVDLADGSHTVDVGTPPQIRADFSRLILRTHTPRQVFENADYRLTWYQFGPAKRVAQH